MSYGGSLALDSSSFYLGFFHDMFCTVHWALTWVASKLLTVVAGTCLEKQYSSKKCEKKTDHPGLKTFFHIGFFRSALPLFFEDEAKNMGKYLCVVTAMAPSLTVSRVNRLTPVHTLWDGFGYLKKIKENVSSFSHLSIFHYLSISWIMYKGGDTIAPFVIFLSELIHMHENVHIQLICKINWGKR